MFIGKSLNPGQIIQTLTTSLFLFHCLIANVDFAWWHVQAGYINVTIFTVESLLFFQFLLHPLIHFSSAQYT